MDQQVQSDQKDHSDPFPQKIKHLTLTQPDPFTSQTKGIFKSDFHMQDQLKRSQTSQVNTCSMIIQLGYPKCFSFGRVQNFVLSSHRFTGQMRLELFKTRMLVLCWHF